MARRAARAATARRDEAEHDVVARGEPADAGARPPRRRRRLRDRRSTAIGNGRSPVTTCSSEWHMPEAAIFTSTSPAFGGSSSISSTLHGLFCSQRIAAFVFISLTPSCRWTCSDRIARPAPVRTVAVAESRGRSWLVQRTGGSASSMIARQSWSSVVPPSAWIVARCSRRRSGELDHVVSEQVGGTVAQAAGQRRARPVGADGDGERAVPGDGRKDERAVVRAIGGVHPDARCGGLGRDRGVDVGHPRGGDDEPHAVEIGGLERTHAKLGDVAVEDGRLDRRADLGSHDVDVRAGRAQPFDLARGDRVRHRRPTPSRRGDRVRRGRRTESPAGAYRRRIVTSGES